MNSDNKQKLCIEVLADNNIEDLTGELLTAMRNAVGVSDDEDLSESVSAVVTGISSKAARGIVQHAVSEAGLSTDWNSNDFQVVEPNVETTEEFLDEENYENFDNPEKSMAADAFRQAARYRTERLVEGSDEYDAVDQFVLIHDADGANADARAFADNVLEQGGILTQHPVEGVPQDDESENADADADVDADNEPSDEAVEEEFEDLVEA